MGIGNAFRIRTSHTRFLLVFTFVLYAICNALNIDKLARWFHQKDGLDYPALIAYLIAGLCLFLVFFTLLAHRRTIKPVAIVLVIVSAAVTYFVAKYNVAIDSSMVLNAIHTDKTEVGQLLSLRMVPYILFLAILPALIILATEITFEPSGRYLFGSAKLIVIALLVAVGSLYSNYNAISRAGNVSKKYIIYSLVPDNFLASGVSVASDLVAPYLQFQKKDVPITGRVAAPGNLMVVLAIGEASRRKSFSLYGYSRRDTNPVLEKTSGLHLLDGIAVRGSTLYALPQILEKDDVKLTSIVSKLGIPTSCYVNYSLYDNCKAVGEKTASRCGHGGKCYDEDVIPMLDEDLKSYASGYRFVVMHLGGGSHGPIYSDRYPPEYQQFKPMCNDADVANQCTVEQLYNSYDNTILYVDHVVGEIIRRLDQSGVPYVFMYLSDHGESLLEGGRMFHGMPPGVQLPPEQAQIPLIVKSSVPISIVPRAQYLQQDVFDTVLDLFSIQTPMFDSRSGFIRKGPDPATVMAATSAAAATVARH
jgi:lipid A ethanolaminephosphotransferase